MISNICSWIGRIAKDKILHFLLSYMIFDYTLSACVRLDFSLLLTFTFSLLIVSCAIIGKEFIDKKEYNSFDWWDIVAGYLGVIVKLIPFLVMIL